MNRQKAWLEFIARERAKLVSYVHHLLDDSDFMDGEDIVQDVAMSIFDKADIGKPIENLWAYTYRTLRNRVIDLVRQRKFSESLDAKLPGETGLVLSDILADLKYDSAGDAERKEIMADITQAVETLDEKSKAIFIATEIEQCSFSELSEEWDIPVGTLLSQKSRAMQRLRTELLKIDKPFYSKFKKEG